jgi:hypothetical protein
LTELEEYEEAKKGYEKALEITKKVYGENNIQYATTL